MKKKIYLFSPLFVLVMLSVSVMFAQKTSKTPAPVSAPLGSGKKPVAKTYLGKVTGNIAMGVEEARSIVALPLKITDDKNIPYVISSYQFAYKRIGITEDEATGKTALQSDIAADRFTVTPLPAVWQKNIVDGLHQGEELYFFDIIVADKQGRLFFAPELKITIQ
jgi:hypothetical protein